MSMVYHYRTDMKNDEKKSLPIRLRHITQNAKCEKDLIHFALQYMKEADSAQNGKCSFLIKSLHCRQIKPF